jgi:hypothetical protein
MTTKKRTTPSKSFRIAPLELGRPTFRSAWLPEPPLLFAGQATHVDPKVGIPLYGPRSHGTSRHKQEVRVGFIGTRQSVDHARQFFEECSQGVAGDDDHTPFPGCRADRGYLCDLRLDSGLEELISSHEHREILGIERKRERFEKFLFLLEQKLRLLAERDHPKDYVVLALPDDLYGKCRAVEYTQKSSKVHRDLRRAFKALAMKYQLPTQILRDSTTGFTDSKRRLDHKAVIAWNLFTGLYFKVDGLPWGPNGLPPASCHIGISFFRPLGETSTLRTSVVQAFDENGDGLVLRGHRFEWDEAKQGRSPHLTGEMAEQLLTMVLERYKGERKHLPQRVVIHKTSRFEPDERAGFEQALSKIERFDLVSLCPTSEVRLLRAGKYPPLRGTAFSVADVTYLYTSGYTPALGGYPHGHVPSPLQVADHIGDTSHEDLLREILILTKMNWNSANMAGAVPITLRFSRLVGDVLREVPPEREPSSKYKFYM